MLLKGKLQKEQKKKYGMYVNQEKKERWMDN